MNAGLISDKISIGYFLRDDYFRKKGIVFNDRPLLTPIQCSKYFETISQDISVTSGLEVIELVTEYIYGCAETYDGSCALIYNLIRSINLTVEEPHNQNAYFGYLLIQYGRCEADGDYRQPE